MKRCPTFIHVRTECGRNEFLVSRDAQQSDWRDLGANFPVTSSAPPRIAANQLPIAEVFLRPQTQA